LGVRSGSAGSRKSRSSSTRKRKKHFSAAVVRAWLEAAGPRVLLAGEERAQMRHLHLAEVLDPFSVQVSQTRRNVLLVAEQVIGASRRSDLQKRRKS